MENTGIQFPGSIRIAAAVSVAMLFIVTAVKWSPNHESPLIKIRESAPLSVRHYIDEVDSDGDGLPDWQETLTGTDIYNADSDGDGVPDTVSDASDTFLLSDNTSPTTTDATLAGTIGSRLFDEYTLLKKRGAYTPTQASELGERLSKNIRPDIAVTFYAVDDLTVFDTTSKKTVEEHREALKVAVAPFFNLSEPEFAIYGQFMESGDSILLQKLTDHAEVYREVAEGVREVPVPKDLTSVHLEIVNSLLLFASVLDAMVHEADDPLASLALLGTYSQSELYIQAAFSALANEYRARLFNQLSAL